MLRCEDAARLDRLYLAADRTRRAVVGDAVFFRGLVEISNYCVRGCHYCGLRAANHRVRRYRLTQDDILACARAIKAHGLTTVVLQGGEDPTIDAASMAGLIREIREQTGLTVTLSLGEHSPETLALWHQAGATRYLLRFETSNPSLYEQYHPRAAGLPSRLELLQQLRDIGYEVGSGVLVGLPGQTYADLGRDIQFFATLDLDMIGVGPFVPHPDTPLGKSGRVSPEQVPADASMTFKVIALARLIQPAANVPVTTALRTVDPEVGFKRGLCAGANVVMPNFTPEHSRGDYAIYPGKVTATLSVADNIRNLKNTLAALGRTVGEGHGDSPNRRRRWGGSTT